MRTTLLVAVLMGCGGPLEGELDTRSDAVLVATAPANLRKEPVLAHSPTEAFRRNLVSPPGLEVALSELPVSDGSLHALAGMMGCGFWEIGSGVATLQAGRANLHLTVSDTNAQGEGFSVFFFIDADGDGKCVNEQVYSVELPSLPATSLSFDGSTIQPSYASCWLFTRP
jgi:hypothetical protein